LIVHVPKLPYDVVKGPATESILYYGCTIRMPMGWFSKLLCKVFPYKEIGWKEIGEVFYRWTLFKCRWFKVVLHRLHAPNWHEKCHDHPWDFWAFIIRGGYLEMVDPDQNIGGRGKFIGTVPGSGNEIYWRPVGSLLYRSAETRHNVVTKADKPNWSIVVMTPKRREWGIKDCR
jgi:hypothetical protein